MVPPLFLLTNSFKIPKSVETPAQSFFLQWIDGLKLRGGRDGKAKWKSSEFSDCECANSVLNLPFLNISSSVFCRGQIISSFFGSSNSFYSVKLSFHSLAVTARLKRNRMTSVKRT